MKKFSKLMALILSLLMIASLFTACGDDKKGDEKDDEKTVSEEKEEKLTGEDLLLGKWNSECASNTDIFGEITVCIQFNFNSDNTFKTILTEDTYYDIVDQMIEGYMENFTEEEIAAENGTISKEELKDILIENEPYEEFADVYSWTGTWELDGDTLTFSITNGGSFSAETKLSKGNTTFTAFYQDGEEFGTFVKDE